MSTVSLTTSLLTEDCSRFYEVWSNNLSQQIANSWVKTGGEWIHRLFTFADNGRQRNNKRRLKWK